MGLPPRVVNPPREQQSCVVCRVACPRATVRPRFVPHQHSFASAAFSTHRAGPFRWVPGPRAGGTTLARFFNFSPIWLRSRSGHLCMAIAPGASYVCRLAPVGPLGEKGYGWAGGAGVVAVGRGCWCGQGIFDGGGNRPQSWVVVWGGSIPHIPARPGVFNAACFLPALVV